ncbi:DUF3320 domain-containing protein [Bacillaceae bacterium Marseille-Q3522]|nr:DUF3320 domain-containing protein [Bacillaceae bacterium Marseille-Q3522]
MTLFIQCEYAYDKKINYALQQNHVPVIKTVHLTNNTDEAITNIRLEITANPSFSVPYSINIDRIEARGMMEVKPDLLLLPDFLRSLEEKISGFLTLKIVTDHEELLEKHLPVEILAYDEWPGFTVLPEIIASFITPNRAYVQSVIKEAAAMLEKNTGSGSLDGYQSGNPNRVMEQLAAIYYVLQSHGITYANPPASFERFGQKIRFPDAIAEQKLGTCLDLSLLYAACAEAVGIYSLIIFCDGHAFPGFWLKEYCCAESLQDDKSILTKHLAKGIDEITVVEATALTNKDVSFVTAIQNGRDSLDKPGFFQFFVDIKRCRIGHITPISLRREISETPGPVHEKIAAGAVQQEQLKFDMNKIDIEDVKEEKPAEQPASKILHWQHSLLDFSLRNNLLNYRMSAQGIPLLTPDLGHIEDVLAMGDKIYIKARPAEWSEQTRDFKDQQQFMQMNVVKEDFQNNRLRSSLHENELVKRLVNLYRKAKNTLEENGANSLFIALGFLKWYETPASEKARYAPVLLLPIDMVRLSARKGYYMKARDEEIQINISLIEYLKQKFGIDASKLYDIPHDEHGADVQKVMNSMRRLVMEMKNWDVKEIASIGVFSFSKFVMWHDLVHRQEDLKRNKVVRGLMEGKCTWDVKPSLSEPMSVEKDEQQTVFTPLSSDGTQMEAIVAAGEENSFVLHGPPGSGKSQTITNLIANALAKGKTVLFVAEKMAALSVVQNRLASLGIDPFCLEIYSNKAQKKDILNQLETSFTMKKYQYDSRWEQFAAEIAALKKELNGYVSAIHQPTSLGQTLFHMIERYSGLKRAKNILSFDRQTVREKDEVTFKKEIKLIENVAAAGSQCGDLVNHPWKEINRQEYSLQFHDEVKQLLEDIVSLSQKLTQFLSDVDGGLSIGSKGKSGKWVAGMMEILDHLRILPEINFAFLHESKFERLQQQMMQVIAMGKEHNQLKSEILQQFDDSVLKINSEELLFQLRQAENSWVLKKVFAKRKVSKQLSGYQKNPGKIKAENVQALMEKINRVQELHNELGKNSETMETYLQDVWLDKNWLEMEQALTWVIKMRKTAETFFISEEENSEEFLSVLSAAFASHQKWVRGEKGQQLLSQTRDTFYQLKQKLEKFTKQLVMKEYVAEDSPDWISSIILKADQQLKSLNQLKDICNFVRVRDEAITAGLENVVTPYLEGKLQHEELVSCFEYGFYRVRIDEEITNHPALSKFSSVDFEKNIERFSQLDEESQELAKIEVYMRLMENAPDLSNHLIQSSEPGILLKAIKSKGRGIAIRKLFERIPNLLLKIKPCMLMSPLSVAQYLDPSFPEFDLVVFDEASQLPTSEAVGAMARGKEVIVVGDPKQLPPTSFFKTQQLDDDDFDIQDLESVLDDCLAMQMPQKHLRWHYRSEHESLISFSNNHYYENKLITFPSTDDLTSRVSFRKVNGIYERGKSKQNRAEAEAVVEEIFQRLHNRKTQKQSIGVITFNQIQQTLIEDLIDERLKEDADLEKYFTDQVAEPVFVKNLENVQGDERDLILFSVGYGPDENGNVSLNFGPLNRDGGWRRLNVAVSRAKKEMIVFASMDPDQIQLSRTKAEGVHGLRAFMEFAKKGKEPLLLENRNVHLQANSEVIAKKIQLGLQHAGYESKLSVGSSEYKVDVAVLSRKEKGEYLAAIQIDGPRYADALTTRDRDKLKETMMDRLGWHIIKVWSADWFYDEEKQLNRIIQRLSELENQPDDAENTTVREPAKLEKLLQEAEPVISGQKQEEADVYKQAHLSEVSFDHELFYTFEAIPMISEQIHNVVAQEAPVSLDQLGKRVADAWGFTKTGTKIKEVIENVVEQLALFKTEEEKGVFIWENEEQYRTFTRFRLAGENRRSPEDICKEEYANGVLAIMQSAISLPKADLYREIGKQLGYTRSGNLLQKYVQEAVVMLIDKEILAKEGEDHVRMR